MGHVSLYIDPWVYILGAVIVLVLPLKWLVCIMAAACVHELFHILALWLLGNKLVSVRIGCSGAELETYTLTPFHELLSSLAGPCGSFLLILFCRQLPELAICGAAQGLFNMIPIYPLDGGRAVRSVLMLLLPNHYHRIGNWIETWVKTIAILAAAAIFLMRISIIPIGVLLLFLRKSILRKKPCKACNFRVQ